MEIPPTSTGAMVFLLESKSWENGSNNYVTDATKQAVGVEGSEKCFRLRVTSQTVECCRLREICPLLCQQKAFFKYRGVYLS